MADIVVKTNNGSETYTGIESVTFNTTQEGVKATFIAQKQADWLQNDETAVDYIKNKPFYENEDAVVKLDNKYLNILEQENVNENVILAEQTFEGFAYNESVGIYLKSGYSLFALQEGETYRVLWDGKQHTCVAYSHLYNGYDAVCLGNEGFAKGESTDLIEPFVIYHVLASGYNGLGAMDSETSHTVAIYQAAAATYKINKTYLPEDIGKQADWNQTDDTAVDFIKNKPENLATEIYVQEQIANIEIPSSQIQSDWEQTDSKALDFIKNKPFGEMSDIIPEQELTFVLTDDAPAIRTSSIAVGQPIVIGETYKVTWDDTTYELVAKDTKDISTGSLEVIIESSPYLGNSNISGLGFGMTDWGEDTGEPFLIGFSASNNNTVTINTTDIVNTTHTISIAPANKMKKLSPEWLPDGLATEEFVREQIAAIEIPEGGGSSGGSISTEKVIYAEDTWDTFYSDSYFSYIFVQAFGESVPAFPLELGDECVVVWDGVEYEVTVGDSSNILADTLFVGNGSQFGLLGNGEPFAIAWDSTGVTFVVWTETEVTGHTVRIYQKTPISVSWENVTDKPFGEDGKLDNKHLDILESASELSECLPSTTSTNVYYSDFGAFAQTFGLEQSIYEKWMANRDEVIVQYDDVEYKTTPQLITGADGSVGVCVGELTSYGGTSNGEPFVIIPASMSEGFALICFSTVDTTPTEHTIAIYFQEEICVIKESYIPDSVKLPAATAEDNNKFLRIVNGVPAWVSLTDVSQEGA